MFQARNDIFGDATSTDARFNLPRASPPAGSARFRSRRAAGRGIGAVMQTMDPITATPRGALASPAVARNTGPILEVLKAHMPGLGRVLEIAAGED